METSLQTDSVRGVLHEPESPNGNAVVLTHGAGSNANAPLLVALARDFAAAGFLVLRYDLPFRFAGAKGPLNEAAQARDREGIRNAIDAIRPRVTGRIVAGGHSYGGRQTATAAAADQGLAAALLLLSYPLHPPDKPQQLRTAFFPELRIPALFVHGTRDPFGAIEELRAAIRTIPAPTEILEVDRTAHDLRRAIKLGTTILDHVTRLAGPF
jgi:predicted alpha/beta-hydrolase family hydrolase